MIANRLAEDPVYIVKNRDMVVLKIDGDDWYSIVDRRHGSRRFTINCDVGLLEGVRTPTFCVIYTESPYENRCEAYLGILKSKRRTATIGGTIAIRECHPITPMRLCDLNSRLKSARYRNDFRARTESSDQRLVRLPAGLSVSVLEALLAIDGNRKAFSRLLRSGLLVPARPRPVSARLQRSAIEMALAASGFPKDATPTALDIFDDEDTALYDLEGRLQEDSVVAHDARQIDGMVYVGSKATGVARFEDGRTVLDVITGNKLPLEEALGVDLVYVNETQRNIALVQYKMLERLGRDWIYRPDRQLAEELRRMDRLSTLDNHSGPPYRLSSEYLFLKFVKRDSRNFGAPVILPLMHFRQLCALDEHKGPKGAFRISYDALAGHYLREQPFLELVRDGYLGSYPSTMRKIKVMIAKLLAEGRPAVVAIRRQLERPQEYDDVADDDTFFDI